MKSRLATPALLGLPLVWLLVFFVVPVGIVGAYSVDALHGPEIFAEAHTLTLAGWTHFLHSSIYLGLFWKSVKMSLIVSLVVVMRLEAGVVGDGEQLRSLRLVEGKVGLPEEHLATLGAGRAIPELVRN